VISLISEELARVSSQKASSQSSKNSVKAQEKDISDLEENPYSTPWSAPALSKQYTIIGVAGAVILVLAFAVQGMRPAEPVATPTPTIAPTPDYAPKPSSAAPKAPSSSKPKKTASAAKCSEAAIAVTMVRNVFTDASATPNQVSQILNEAARMWAKEAQGSSGSKRDWLLKMNELSLAVDSYLITGSPSNGATKFDQLFANMGLVNNFCN
jgi:hypothetical protein